jgi:hypothetical protein
MDGKAKLEKLTNSWYGFALFTGVATFFMNGIGIFSIIGAAISTTVSLVLAFVFGRLLMRKSSFTRFFLIVVSGLAAVLGIVGIGGAIYTFFGEWSLSLLVYAGFCAVSVYMYAKSFSVLTDKSVKGYFA